MDNYKDKITVFAVIKPYDINIELCCHLFQSIGDIYCFIEETMRPYQIDYQIGRIDLKSKATWLLPNFVCNLYHCYR